MVKKPAPTPGHNGDASNELRAYIERIERLEEEKKAIAGAIKDMKTEAKGRGYSVKAIERIVKERTETPAQKELRRETEALTDVYRAALGMLDGTALGDAARDRLSKQNPAPEDQAPAEEAPAPASTITAEDIAKARADGEQGAKTGKRIIDNPFTAGDPRRAAWDEGWCAASGSDGMDIPPAWRRADKKKDKKPAESGKEGE